MERYVGMNWGRERGGGGVLIAYQHDPLCAILEFTQSRNCVSI